MLSKMIKDGSSQLPKIKPSSMLSNHILQKDLRSSMSMLKDRPMLRRWRRTKKANLNLTVEINYSEAIELAIMTKS